MLSMYPKTTELFGKFSKIKEIEKTPFKVIYYYKTMHLKNFCSVSVEANGRTQNYDVGFIVERCYELGRPRNEILMTDLKREYYKRFITSGSDDITISLIESVKEYIEKVGEIGNDTIVQLKSIISLKAQDSYSRNHPSYLTEYGETETYFINEIVVNKQMLVWAE